MKKEKVDKIVFGDYNGGFDSGCRIVLKKDYSHIEVIKKSVSDSGRKMTKIVSYKWTNEEMIELIEFFQNVDLDEWKEELQ
tara:strand:- start:349 stop:591 length:243 start_codon:yes stop_codon:yes gene_type:complete